MHGDQSEELFVAKWVKIVKLWLLLALLGDHSRQVQYRRDDRDKYCSSYGQSLMFIEIKHVKTHARAYLVFLRLNMVLSIKCNSKI